MAGAHPGPRPRRRARVAAAALVGAAAVAAVTAVVVRGGGDGAAQAGPVGGAGVGAGVGAEAGRAAADPARPADRLVPAGAGYVALGSSFAAGPGLAPVADVGCARSAANYPQRVAAALELTLTDVTCSGTTTDNVLTKPHDAGGVQVPPQLDALAADTRLVTITVGGNDIGYVTALTDFACIQAGDCPGYTVDRGAVDAATAAVESRLVVTLEAVRAAAPRAVVMLVTYPQIVPASGATCAEIGVTAPDAGYGAGLERLLHDVSVSAAGQTGATVVDAYAASAGRDACGGGGRWVGGYPPADGPGVQAFHPTEAGMAGQADLVVAALTRQP